MKGAIANVFVLVLLALGFAIWMTSAFMLSGCGKKALPNPPSGNRPPKVIDISYNINETTIKLTWIIPKTSDKAKSPVTGFYIFRSKQSPIETDCLNCPIHFLKIGDILVKGDVSGKPERSVVFSQTIEPGYRYIYKVSAYNDDGVAGQDSKLISFTY